MKKLNLPKLRISLPFTLLIATLYALDFGKVFAPTFAAVIIHELSHIIATRACGGSISSVDVRIFGIRVDVPELKLMSYKREIIIAAAGPLAGILTAGIAAVTARYYDIPNIDYFIGINIVISAINLIPVYPLDGGRIVLSLALSLFSLNFASALCKCITFIAIFGLLLLCTVFALSGILNPSLVIFSLYIAMCGIRFRAPF
ncbi:MAG: hypothetical protein IJO09_10055 [Oscillospiraceae bacterium]|nr:hypothetical protein [Oscillospiraceae bacterium]